MNTLATRPFTIRSFIPVPGRQALSRDCAASANRTPAPVPHSRAAQTATPIVHRLALPRSQTTLVERVLTGTLALVAAAALAEALSLMFRLAPPWEGFHGWTARILL